MGTGHARMNTIALIPLDERPVNLRYPQQLLSQHPTAKVIVPPTHSLSNGRNSADWEALHNWLTQVVPNCEVLIVSLEQYVYGGLITSRISHEPFEHLMTRLATLKQLKEQHPTLKIWGFNVITRISRHNDATEEPFYWAEWGAKLFEWSQLTHRQQLGEAVLEQKNALEAVIPPHFLADFVMRRERNHKVNQQALALLADDTLDLLVLSSDDTSQYGLSSHEKEQLTAYSRSLGLNNDKLLMYAGADEVGCVLVARYLNQASAYTPRFELWYSIPEGANITAPFEDVPIQATLLNQIKAIGGQVVTENAECVLIVNPPVNSTAEWVQDYPNTLIEPSREKAYFDTAQEIKARHARGQRVALADVAYANGASHALMLCLIENQCLALLSAFGAWNTAGNTLGTVLAQACLGDNRMFMAHRLLEDWGYQTVVRYELRAWLMATHRTIAFEESQMESVIIWAKQALQRFSEDYHLGITLETVRFPWRRTFEIDFDLVLNHMSKEEVL